MPRLTVTITEEQAALLDERTGDGGEYESKSEAVRDFIQSGEELQNRVDELETEVERLRNEKRTILSQREENQELVRFVEDEMERREQRDTAPVWTRAKWWVLGREADG